MARDKIWFKNNWCNNHFNKSPTSNLSVGECWYNCRPSVQGGIGFVWFCFLVMIKSSVNYFNILFSFSAPFFLKSHPRAHYFFVFARCKTRMWHKFECSGVWFGVWLEFRLIGFVCLSSKKMTALISGCGCALIEWWWLTFFDLLLFLKTLISPCNQANPLTFGFGWLNINIRVCAFRLAWGPSGCWSARHVNRINLHMLCYDFV